MMKSIETKHSRKPGPFSFRFPAGVLALGLAGGVGLQAQVVNSFTLIDADADAPVAAFDPLPNGAVIDLATLPGTNLNVRANTTPATDFGSVQFALTGATTRNQLENLPVWALAGNTDADYNAMNFNPGSHTLTATPYDANGGAGGGGNAGTALTINFTVINTPPVTNNPPVVTLVAPANGATYTEPASIEFEATVVAGDGVVTNVEFYAGATKLGEDGSSPYSFSWSGVSAGAYSLTARALDTLGSVGVSAPAVVSVLSTNTNGVVSGELRQWHCVTVAFTGPATDEKNAYNPFRNYRLNVTFTHPGSSRTYLVPGFYAADGNAADTSATGGDQWHVRFAPDELGTWNYIASFRTGVDVATNTSPTAGSAAGFDGASGSFSIVASDKTGRNLRAKGRLDYVGEHHLRFAGTGEYFLKCGADAPENLLAYDDLDNTPNTGNRRKSWAPHAGDYNAVDAAAYTWKGGLGANLLGAVSYLSGKGMNAFSFLTFNIDGDDDNVFPHLLANTVADYEAVADNQRWNSGTVYKDRFDVSKMEQWDRVFAYGDKKGMHLHFKTQETENDQRMDGGAVGVERQLYYRELIARYSYHLALNWNLGEENTNTEQQRKDMAQYFWDHDPYRHNIVLHTYPGQKGSVYTPLLGSASRLTGLSLQTSQTNFTQVFAHTKEWVDKSAQAGKPWVVACDEPGDATHSLVPDSDTAVFDPQRNNSRKNGLWGNVMAGGAGLEWYFGYQHAHSDLTCQDFRSRDLWWDQCRHMLSFFADHDVPFQEMSNDNGRLSDTSNYCLFKSNEVYVVFLKSAAVNTLDLSDAAGDFSVAWFDPRNGGALQSGTVTQVTAGASVSLGAPPVSSSNDWVALVRSTAADITPPDVIINSPTNSASLPRNLPVDVSATITDDVAVALGELWVDGILQPPALTNPPFDFSVVGLTLGVHTLAVVGEDTSANRATNSVDITVAVPEPPPLTLVSTGGVDQIFWDAPGFDLQHAFDVLGPWTSVMPPPLSPYTMDPTNNLELFRLHWMSP